MARRVFRTFGLFAALLVTAAALPRPGLATIRNVPAGYATPQAAVTAAVSGDTVLIAPGTYLGGVFVQNKALVVGSWFLTTGDTTYIAQTVLDTVMTNPCPGGGCAGDAVIEFDHANNSKVVGLTIQRGKDGVRLTNQSGGVPNRVDIEWCHCLYNEDGVDVQNGGRGTFSNNLFAYSTDDGLDLNHGVDLTIVDNMITENSDDGIEFRLYTLPPGTPLLTVSILNNKFIHNDSDGIQLIDDVDTISTNRYINIRKNLFANNRKATLGCMPNLGTDENFSGAPTVEKIHFINNTIVGDGYGICGGANLVAVNNIVKDVLGSAFRNVIAPNSIAAHNLAYNCGTVNDNSNVDMGTTLQTNPLLAADYHLTPSSPAINAGVATYMWRGEDVVALPPTGYSGSAPDLGAYELNTNAPVCQNDSYLAPQSTLLSISAPGVLSNDTDPNLDPLTASAVITGPFHGGLTLNLNGSFQYTNNGDGAPRDSFVYEASDGTGNTGRATCVLVIQLPNAPPVAEFDAFLVDLNSSVNGLDVLGNDHDPDAADFISLQSLNTAGTVGTVVIQGDLVEYTPPPAFTGFDYFTYTIHDIQGATSTVTVNVRVEDVTTTSLAVKVNAGADDAEESATGVMSLSSGDLEMTYDGTTQKVGMRFGPLAIPQGAQIRRAWIQFKTDEIWPDATNLLVRAQAADNVSAAFTFTTAANNISSRPLGTKSAAWVPPLWNLVDEAGPSQQTPSLVRVVSEIINRPGWASGNGMAMIVTGTGRRVAKAFESDAPGAPMLHVDFITGTYPLAVGDEPGLDFALGVRPSPARGPLGLELALPRADRATIELLDVTGRRVVFRDLGVMTPGRHRIELREPLAAGLYVVRLTHGGASRTAKAVVLR